MPSSFGRQYWLFEAEEELSPWRRAPADEDVGGEGLREPQQQQQQQEPQTSTTTSTLTSAATSTTALPTPILPIQEDEEEERAKKRRRREIDCMSAAELMQLTDAEIEALIE